MPPSSPSFPLPLRLVAVALLGAAVLAVLLAGAVAAEDPSPEPVIIVVTATPYRCTNGDVLGSSTACPMAVLNVGPTQTPDPFNVVGQAGDGREFAVGRSWTYGDVAIVAPLWVLVIIAGIYVGYRFYARG